MLIALVGVSEGVAEKGHADLARDTELEQPGVERVAQVVETDVGYLTGKLETYYYQKYMHECDSYDPRFCIDKEATMQRHASACSFISDFENDPEYQAGMVEFSCTQTFKNSGPDGGDVSHDACRNPERSCFCEY